MKKSKFSKLIRWAIAPSFALFVILLFWLGTPALLKSATPERALFSQVWQTVNERFYDPKLNGVDWRTMRVKYEPQFLQSRTDEAASAVINQMLSELKTSHTRFYTPLEPAYYQILGIFAPRSRDFQREVEKWFPDGKIQYSGIGIFTKPLNGQTFISAILDGSPAEEAGLLVGDRIISADDRPFQPVKSFEGKAGEKVSLLIQRSAAPDSQKKIEVEPQMLDATTMFLDAQKASTRVIEREGKKIAYVHIWSYAGDQYQQQLEEDLIYGRLREADALVLDLREGWGGAPLTALNIFTARGASITSIPRSGKRYTQRPYWGKPVVMLVNEGSRSAKEILAFAFQQYRIGAVVGAQTAGAVVGGSPFLMQDGSLLYVAVADVFVDEKYRLEGKGVTPDIVVPFTLEYAGGADPQKERAFEVALAALK